MESKELPTRYIVSMIMVSVFLGIFIGHMIKKCPECEKFKYTPHNETSKRIDSALTKAKEEIKIKTNEEIKKILDDPDTKLADSLLRAYAKDRFNYDK